MTPSELLHHLSTSNIRPKKSFSQNFLIDKNIRNKIISASQVTEGDNVIEIGPGLGALTDGLLLAGATVHAIEKDRSLAKKLREKNDSKLFIYEMDFLELNLAKFCEKLIIPPKRIKIVANLPYQITSPILSKILPLHQIISSMTFMLQKEVAERITAKPGSKSYGRLSIFAQLFSRPTCLFHVSPNCFLPKPKVDSSVIHCKLQETSLSQDSVNQFISFIKMVFSCRRKTLSNCLKKAYSTKTVHQALFFFNKLPSERAENLTLDELMGIFSHLLHQSENDQAYNTNHEEKHKENFI